MLLRFEEDLEVRRADPLHQFELNPSLAAAPAETILDRTEAR
jgi:hypothetical protein